MLVLQLIVIQVATFIGLVLVLRRLLYTETSKALRRLQQLNKENETKAEELRKKNEEAERQYLEKLRKAEEEAKKTKEMARIEMEQLKVRCLDEAKKESERIITTAHNRKEAMRSEIAVEMEAKAVDVAGELLQQVFDAEAVKDVHRRLVGEIVVGAKNLDVDRIETGLNDAEVTSAYPLSAGDKQKLQEILSKKARREINMKHKLDDKLIAGIVIKIGNLMLDGSISNKLQELKKRLKKNIG